MKSQQKLLGDINTAVDMLYDLFGQIWQKEEIPSDCKEAHIIKIPKRDLSKCTNYRGISLLSVPGKIFNRII
jgi:hypothetical protein